MCLHSLERWCLTISETDKDENGNEIKLGKKEGNTFVNTTICCSLSGLCPPSCNSDLLAERLNLLAKVNSKIVIATLSVLAHFRS